MAIKLKSLFQGQRSALLLKTLLFAAAFFAAERAGGGVLAAIFFLGAASILFAAPFTNTRSYAVSFAVLVILSLLFGSHFPGHLFLVAVAAAIIFYCLLGLKNRYVISRNRLHYFAVLALSYGDFFLFFASDRSTLFTIKAFLLFIVTFFLWRELFYQHSLAPHPSLLKRGQILEIPQRMRKLSSCASSVISFTALEVAWAASLTSLSVVNAATLTLLTVFIFGDATSRAFDSSLSRRAMLGEITIFTMLAIVIFALN